MNSFAMEILEDYKKANKRMFIIILALLGMLLLTTGYLVYVLNDIGMEEITETYDVTQESDENGNNNFINRSENING